MNNFVRLLQNAALTAAQSRRQPASDNARHQQDERIEMMLPHFAVLPQIIKRRDALK